MTIIIWQVQLASDAECDDLGLQKDVQEFMRNLAIPYRSLIDQIYGRLHHAKVRMVDEDGNRVTGIDLSAIEEDGEAFDLWLRDWIKERSVNSSRRVRPGSRERIRLLITLLRMIFPKESTVWGKPPASIGMPYKLAALDDQRTYE